MLEIGGFNSVQEAINNYDDLGKDFYYNPKKRKEFLTKLNKDGKSKILNLEPRRKTVN